MKNKIVFLLIVCLFSVIETFGQKASKQGKICGNPNIKCKTDKNLFEPNEIPFETSTNFAIFESQTFYAVILKSKRVADIFADDNNCKNVASEEKRLNVQKLFPNNKVFTQNCGYNNLYYTGIQNFTVFIAVYGGRTLAEAQNFLKTVKQKSEFEGAYIKKMQAQFNGT